MPQNKPMKIQWITVNGRQVPLVLPQTYSYKDDDWKVTSDRDPLPVVEYGTTAGGIVVPKRVSDEGHELTQLTGSNVEELTIVNALAITDTEPIFLGSGTGFDTTKYKRIKLLALSTLDAQVAIRFRYRNANYSTYFWDGSNWVFDQEKQAIIGSGFLYDLNSIWDFLNDQPVRSFGLRIQAQSVPTSGALTVYLWGVLK